MTCEKIRDMANPYFPLTSRLSSRDFIGREEEISKLQKVLEEYKKTSNLRNFVISGEKSVGKSSLLHRYKRLLEDYNFVVYEQELPRSPSIEIDEFEFFKSILDDLFIKYGSPDGPFFDPQQSEIWFSLTSDKYEHESTFQDRKLTFATQYANRKKGMYESLSPKIIENDFEQMLNQLISLEIEIDGFAILIDEFQELKRNLHILNILRLLSETLPGLIIIGSGLPTFLDDPIFEKFSRLSTTINLKNMSQSKILNLILQPLEDRLNLSRYEARRCFDIRTLDEIQMRSGGNPLHVKVLCGTIVDHFQENTNLSLLRLDKTVMQEVMDYYSSISDRSKKISLSLESCKRDQLDSFNLLYQYEGFSIRTTILLELAFKPINSTEETIVRDRIFQAFKDIWGLGLFEFENESITFQTFSNLSDNELAHFEYKFTGDAIDKLYAKYFYEELTHEQLIDNGDRTFEEILAMKLTTNFTEYLFNSKIPQDIVFDVNPLTKIASNISAEGLTGKEVITDLDRLINVSAKEEKETERDELREISIKHDLNLPAVIASVFDLEGYYVLIIDTIIRGKSKLIYHFIPIKTTSHEIIQLREELNEMSIDNSILSQYMIQIRSTHIYWLPNKPLLKVFYVDVGELRKLLWEKVSNRDFESAVSFSDNITGLMTRLKLSEGKFITELESCNNHGFCLININNLEDAKKQLELCQDKKIVSKVNLSIVLFLQKDFDGARNILKRLFKKHLGKDHQMSFMHLALDHPKLYMEQRIVEDVILYNIVSWNLALINAQEKRSEASIYSYLKKLQPRGTEVIIDGRVRTWINFYGGKFEEAIQKAESLLTKCEVDYLRTGIESDIKIFKNEDH